MADKFAACSIPATRDFLDEYVALCEKHGMVLVPTYEGQVSFHDSLECVPLDKASQKFVMQSGVDVTKFNPPLELYRG